MAVEPHQRYSGGDQLLATTRECLFGIELRIINPSAQNLLV
jgi:hypothetical protein